MGYQAASDTSLNSLLVKTFKYLSNHRSVEGPSFKSQHNACQSTQERYEPMKQFWKINLQLFKLQKYPFATYSIQILEQV